LDIVEAKLTLVTRHIALERSHWCWIMWGLVTNIGVETN